MAIIPISETIKGIYPTSVILKEIIEDRGNELKNGNNVENTQPTETKKTAEIIDFKCHKEK